MTTHEIEISKLSTALRDAQNTNQRLRERLALYTDIIKQLQAISTETFEALTLEIERRPL